MSISSDGLLFWGLCWNDSEGLPEWAQSDNEDEEPWERAEYWENMAAEKGLTFSIHCSYDCPMYYLAPKMTYESAGRGNAQELPPEHFTVLPQWRATLQEFCETHNIPWQEPSWWLASLFG